MSVTVRDADVERDRDELVSFQREHLTPRADDARFDWLYLRNPHGKGRAWIAADGRSGRTVGIAGAFPRRMWLDGKPGQGWILGDFCIAPENRSLGPALVLQRACLDSLASEEDTLCVDFPSQAMLAVYMRLGVRTSINLALRVRLLRIDTKVRNFVPFDFLARGISAVGNSILKFQPLPRAVSGSLEVSAHHGPFGEEFSAFDLANAGRHGLQGLRTADYLNWRYRDNPLGQYHAVVVRRGSELLGYAVLEIRGMDCVLADLQLTDEVNTAPAILPYVDRFARKLKLERIIATVTEESALRFHLRGAGYYRRGNVPLVVHPAKARAAPSVLNTRNCFLMDGDRES